LWSPVFSPFPIRGLKMTAFVALFRGINVGGHHQVKMSELKALHESLGLTDVLPYIQSGNVVFTCDDADVASVPQLHKLIEDGFENKFGFHSQVLIRSSAELKEIIDHNPLPNQESRESKWMAVMFLAACPSDSAQHDLLTTYVGPEELFFSGKELYLYYPNGIGRSKLTNGLIEKKLKTFGTARNWNTLLQLQKLLQQ
jgi:uncharacterized protein (DUF1697 family)